MTANYSMECIVGNDEPGDPSLSNVKSFFFLPSLSTCVMFLSVGSNSSVSRDGLPVDWGHTCHS